MTPKPALLLLAIPLLVALSPIPVAAQEPDVNLVLIVGSEAAVGKELDVQAHLQDLDGNPIQGEVVTFYQDVEFLNVAEMVEIGQAITDEEGRALLTYTPKSEGEQIITARFDGNGIFPSAEVSESLPVAPGPATYTEESPFRIPGANITIVVVALTTTWSLFLVVVGLLWLVSRDESEEGSRAGVY